MSGVHQFVPMLHRGDAVGRHTLHVRDVLQARGVASQVYVEMVDPATESECEQYGAYAAHAEPGDVLLYQFATASGLAPWLAARTETLVVNYHNITPPELYAPWDNALARHQVLALTQLSSLAGRAALGVAVSRFNESDLVRAGYRATAVVPPAAVLPPAGDRPAPSSATGNSIGEAGGTRWLCVGRVAPNKALEHAAMGLLVARAHHDAAATLTIVGRPVVPSYTRALQRFVAELGLTEAVSFRGPLSDDALFGVLAGADVLVLTSRHEGFGVPVIEAMLAGVPVVANRMGALPEVVGEGGLLVDTADPWALAAAVADTVDDPVAQGRRAAAAQGQVAALDLATAADRLVDLVMAQMER
jgi:glycosyltransferase involved in cell wall biosynthesis